MTRKLRPQDLLLLPPGEIVYLYPLTCVSLVRATCSEYFERKPITRRLVDAPRNNGACSPAKVRFLSQDRLQMTDI